MPDRSHYFANGSPWSPDLLADWRWLVGSEDFTVLRVTAMGSLLLKHPDESLHFLNTSAGTLNRLAEPADAVDSLPESSDHRFNLFFSFLVRDLRSRGLQLAPGQCYSWKVPTCLGGEPDAANVEPADVTVHVSILGQIHQQIRQLPDGTPIDQVQIKTRRPKM